jgi:hypothetical protein
VNAGSSNPGLLTIVGSLKVAQVNQQAAAKKAKTIPWANLFMLLPFSFFQFERCDARDSRDTSAANEVGQGWPEATD